MVVDHGMPEQWAEEEGVDIVQIRRLREMIGQLRGRPWWLGVRALDSGGAERASG